MAILKPIAAVIIGSELLTGKRQDQHAATLIGKLNAKGLCLKSLHIIGDDPNQITQTLAGLHNQSIVFSFGGIGATPDDLTRACAAKATNQPLALHPQAKAIIEEVHGDKAYPTRINMGVIPNTAALIPNPVNRMPGFSVGDSHFLPGFPSMAWPMIDWVLEQHYQSYFTAKQREALITAHDVAESELVDEMQTLINYYPQLSIACLPCAKPGSREIEFGIRGDEPLVLEAQRQFEAALSKREICYNARLV